MPLNVDNLSESEQKRRKLIEQIQELHKNQVSTSEIVRITGCSYKTVSKYLEGDPDKLCRSNVHGHMERYTDFIIKGIQSGLTQSAIARQLADLGYGGTSTNARRYVCMVAEANGLEIAKYSNVQARYKDDGSKKPEMDYIKRKGIFNYLWMNGELTQNHRDYLWEQFPVLWEIERCIKEFRELFDRKSMPHLYLFIERYKSSEIKELCSFANGLEKDIRAVENAVASELSNGFVEGTNSKLKMVKRTMYGRCGKQLLEAKLMYRFGVRY
jgi:hypothetical protein